jgi:hypothetical protein
MSAKKIEFLFNPFLPYLHFACLHVFSFVENLGYLISTPCALLKQHQSSRCYQSVQVTQVS